MADESSVADGEALGSRFRALLNAMMPAESADARGEVRAPSVHSALSLDSDEDIDAADHRGGSGRAAAAERSGDAEAPSPPAPAAPVPTRALDPLPPLVALPLDARRGKCAASARARRETAEPGHFSGRRSTAASRRPRAAARDAVAEARGGDEGGFAGWTGGWAGDWSGADDDDAVAELGACASRLSGEDDEEEEPGRSATMAAVGGAGAEEDDDELPAFAPPWAVALLAARAGSARGGARGAPARGGGLEGELRDQFQALAAKARRTRRERLGACALSVPLIAILAHGASIDGGRALGSGADGADGAPPDGEAWGGDRLQLWCFGAAVTNALACAFNAHQLAHTAAVARTASGAGAQCAPPAVPVLLPLPLLDFRMLALLRVRPSRGALRRLPLALVAWVWGLAWSWRGLADALAYPHEPDWPWSHWFLHRLVSACTALHVCSAALALGLAVAVVALTRGPPARALGATGGGGGGGACDQGGEARPAARHGSAEAEQRTHGLRCVRALRPLARAFPLWVLLLAVHATLVLAAAAVWSSIHWRSARVRTSVAAFAFADVGVIVALLGVAVPMAGRLAELRLEHVRAGGAGASAAALAAATPGAARARGALARRDGGGGAPASAAADGGHAATIGVASSAASAVGAVGAAGAAGGALFARAAPRCARPPPAIALAVLHSPTLSLAVTAYTVLVSALLCLHAAARRELAVGASAALRALCNAIVTVLAIELGILCAIALALGTRALAGARASERESGVGAGGNT